MSFPKNRIIKIIVMLVFLSCMLFANFVAVRMLMRYGVDTYFYDKLLVAYTVGGREGLNLELGKMPVTDKFARESVLAKDFAIRLETLADPGAFLENKVDINKRMVNLIRNLRSAAIYLMLILFACKLIIDFINKHKSGKSA